jgi:hypothetical protein
VAVLSIDLATRRWSDLGVVVLSRGGSRQGRNLARPGLPLKPLFHAPNQVPADPNPVLCEMIQPASLHPEPGPVDANILAGVLNHLCGVRNIRMIVLDGPQAWKSSRNGLDHARVSERQLNTAAKTGLPGLVKPFPFRTFAEFCLDVYDGLCHRGWRRLDTLDQPGSPMDQRQERVLVESYPHAAWKSLGLKPLPSKRRARVSDLAEAYAGLSSLISIATNRPPNHDQLQAIVGGLPGLALEERNTAAARIVGKPPRREDGHWREGFIVLPLPPLKPISLRWLD